MRFKEDISTAGANDAAAWTRKFVPRSFTRRETHARGRNPCCRLRDGRIYPHENLDAVRILRKVVRGLAFYHGVFLALPEDLVVVSPVRYEIPPELLGDARFHDVRHPEIFE